MRRAARPAATAISRTSSRQSRERFSCWTRPTAPWSGCSASRRGGMWRSGPRRGSCASWRASRRASARRSACTSTGGAPRLVRTRRRPGGAFGAWGRAQLGAERARRARAAGRRAAGLRPSTRSTAACAAAPRRRHMSANVAMITRSPGWIEVRRRAVDAHDARAARPPAPAPHVGQLGSRASRSRSSVDRPRTARCRRPPGGRRRS